jgi:GT2 family glycosyltransferase
VARGAWPRGRRECRRRSLMPRLPSLLVSGALALLSVRRAILLAAALLPPRSLPKVADEPHVALLVAAHDEAPTLDRLLATIEQLDWPRDRLHVVLVDDGSTDGTWERMQAWAQANERVQALRAGSQAGKSQALNAALAAAPPRAEIVVAADADLRLAPDYLRRLVRAFHEPVVAAAAAFVTAANPDDTIVARYVALETWVHQLVTAAGKDRLALNPPTFAGSAYRRSALEEIGGFYPGRAGDDVCASAALTRHGWRTCFVRAASADHVLARGAADYWRQHLRWGRNVVEAARIGVRDGSAARRPRRLELALAAVGYGDRIAFAGALALAATRRLSPAVPAAYAGLRALESVVAVAKAGHARRLHAHLAAAALLLPLDVAASVAAAVTLRSRRPASWRSPERPRSDPLEERLPRNSGGVPG